MEIRKEIESFLTAATAAVGTRVPLLAPLLEACERVQKNLQVHRGELTPKEYLYYWNALQKREGWIRKQLRLEAAERTEKLLYHFARAEAPYEVETPQQARERERRKGKPKIGVTSWSNFWKGY